MKLIKTLQKALLGVSVAAASTIASATALDADDAFYGFWETVDGWTSGALGVGLATTMLLMGGAIGVAKNSPMPALTGVSGAAFLHWGPDVIQQIMLGGGVI